LPQVRAHGYSRAIFSENFGEVSQWLEKLRRY
jgi:hypothetical protein